MVQNFQSIVYQECSMRLPLREFSLTLTSHAIRQLENFETDAIESVSTKSTTQNGNRNQSINQNFYLYIYVAWRALLMLTSFPLYFAKTPTHQHSEKI